MTFIASQTSRQMYIGRPYAVSGIGASIQAAWMQASWMLGNVMPKAMQLCSPTSSVPGRTSWWRPKLTRLSYVCLNRTLRVECRRLATCRRRRSRAGQTYLRDYLPDRPSTSHRRRLDSRRPSRHPFHRWPEMLSTYCLRPERRPNLPAGRFQAPMEGRSTHPTRPHYPTRRFMASTAVRAVHPTRPHWPTGRFLAPSALLPTIPT